MAEELRLAQAQLKDLKVLHPHLACSPVAQLMHCCSVLLHSTA